MSFQKKKKYIKMQYAPQLKKKHAHKYDFTENIKKIKNIMKHRFR